MMATSAFKLIDKIPDTILRWMGGSVSSFSDINQDPTENLTRYAAISGLSVGRQAVEGTTQLGQTLGGGLGRFFR